MESSRQAWRSDKATPTVKKKLAKKVRRAKGNVVVLSSSVLKHLSELIEFHAPKKTMKTLVGDRMLSVDVPDIDNLDPKTKQLIRSSFIPYFRSLFGKGTQIPAIRLYLKENTISITAATDYTTVLQVTAANLLNFSSLAVVFDEYRVIQGEVLFFSNRSYVDPAGSIMGLSAAVIDYDDTSALTTMDGALQYDTRQIFPICSQNRKDFPVAWDLLFDPMPDQDWITTATTSTAFAAWKPFLGATYTGGVTLGSVGMTTGWLDIQFRGSD